MPKQTIEQVQAAHVDEWMAIPGVQGVAIGIANDKPCILVLSSVAPEQLRDRIAEEVQGFPIIIQQTGTFQALDPQ